MTETLKRLALKFRVNKIQVPGIYGPIILCELLNHLSKSSEYKILEGYLQITSTNNLKPEICWHLWVEKDGEKFDINRYLSEKNDEEFKACQFEYLESIDEGTKPKEISEQWELYKNDKKEFWKKSPMKIRNFRSKIFKSL